MYRVALFDIDGTVCDPGTGITDAARHALAQVGIGEDDPAALRRFVGPPLEHSLRDLYDLTPQQVDLAVAAYRQHYGLEGITRYRAYPGIENVLAALQAAGVRLGVVTAKVQPFAEQALSTTGLGAFFDVIAGRSLDEVVTKTVTLRRTLADFDHHDAVMIGDRKHDIDAARANGIDSIGVLYGYGTADELGAATSLAAEPSDITPLVLEGRRAGRRGHHLRG